ncbi:MAG: serine/threonine-protein kinase [Planctomycetota bacterium]
MSVGRDFIGPFQLLRLIRAGSTTQVWEASRTGENARIALKVLLQDYRTDKDQIAALKHEANVGATLKHANVIEIFGYHDDAGIPLIAMELFHARNLKIAMRESHDLLYPNLSPIIRKCALGLKHMHDQGWIHCDVKPDNFLADEEANVKLIDFSIGVKARKGGLSALLGGRPKTIRGTRSYMAPEQIRRKHPDIRSDVYGFGCVIFELLAGKTPFSANSPDELLQKHLSASIPNLEAFSDCSSDMAEVVRKMLSKKPDDRYQSMHEFLHEFKKIQIFKPGKRPEGFKR